MANARFFNSRVSFTLVFIYHLYLHKLINNLKRYKKNNV